MAPGLPEVASLALDLLAVACTEVASLALAAACTEVASLALGLLACTEVASLALGLPS